MRYLAFAAVLGLAACHPSETKLEEVPPFRVEVAAPLPERSAVSPAPHVEARPDGSVDQRLERLQGQVEWMRQRIPHAKP